MATTDTAVLYDIAFFNEFFPQLGYEFDEHQLDAIKTIVYDGLIQRDRLMELAISKIGNLEMCSKAGQDHIDNSDTKTAVSSMRQNIKRRDPATAEITSKAHREGQWTSSFKITNVKTKIGNLRIIVYNKILNKFQYFWIPREEYEHLTKVLEITLEQYYGENEPQWTGNTTVNCKWWKFEVASFAELAAKR
jgi:hypothetical protein